MILDFPMREKERRKLPISLFNVSITTAATITTTIGIAKTVVSTSGTPYNSSKGSL